VKSISKTLQNNLEIAKQIRRYFFIILFHCFHMPTNVITIYLYIYYITQINYYNENQEVIH